MGGEEEDEEKRDSEWEKEEIEIVHRRINGMAMFQVHADLLSIQWNVYMHPASP
jgi:hypothetical protein